jgi:hypothetical protein
MRDRAGRTAFFATAAGLAATATLLASCSSVITGAPVRAPGGPPPGTVDIALLDVGNYPTKPSPQLGAAATPEIGAIVEGQRMANFVTGPWEVDPGLIGSYADSALALKNANALTFVLPEALAAVGSRHNFVAGFFTARDTTDHRTVLRNSVLRFADPPAAAAAAKEFGEAASTEAVLAPPVRAVPIPGHPEAAGFSHTFDQRQQNSTSTVVRAFSARGPYVLLQTAESADGIETAIGLVVKTLDLQGPLIDQFTPTDPASLADLPIDPTGLLARTLPVSVTEASVNQRAVYERRGSLQFQSDPTRSAALFERTGMNRQANAATAVYEARDAQGAKGIVDGFFAEVSATGEPSEPVKQLAGSRCVDLSKGQVSNFYCLATADRFAIEAQSAQLRDAQQKVAAQYAMLVAP